MVEGLMADEGCPSLHTWAGGGRILRSLQKRERRCCPVARLAVHIIHPPPARAAFRTDMLLGFDIIQRKKCNTPESPVSMLIAAVSPKHTLQDTRYPMLPSVPHGLGRQVQRTVMLPRLLRVGLDGGIAVAASVSNVAMLLTAWHRHGY